MGSQSSTDQTEIPRIFKDNTNCVRNLLLSDANSSSTSDAANEQLKTNAQKKITRLKIRQKQPQNDVENK